MAVPSVSAVAQLPGADRGTSAGQSRWQHSERSSFQGTAEEPQSSWIWGSSMEDQGTQGGLTLENHCGSTTPMSSWSCHPSSSPSPTVQMETETMPVPAKDWQKDHCRLEDFARRVSGLSTRVEEQGAAEDGFSRLPPKALSQVIADPI